MSIENIRFIILFVQDKSSLYDLDKALKLTI